MSARRWTRYAKVLATVVVAIGAAALVASRITGITPVISVSEEVAEPQPPQPPNEMMGTVVAPLRDLNFDTGDWAAYILLPIQDYLEVREVVPSTCLELTDRVELKRLQRGLVARYTGSDIATVTSSLVFVRDRKVVYETGIVLRGRDLGGIQTRAWGWLEPEDPRFTTGFAGRFRPVCWPFCIV